MVDTAAPVEEDVALDDQCPICQLLLFNPVRTQCNHLLCASCMAQWADASSTTNLEHVGLDVNLTDFDPTYDPTYDLEANCPMCRTRTSATPDQALARQLEAKYPATYAERRVEEEIERGSRVGQDGVEGVMMLIGNKHRLVRDNQEDANQHDWTFFVRISRPEIVKEVVIDLHPTFRPPSLTLRRPPYEVHRLGWGWFTIQATIVLKEPYSWIIEGRRQSKLELEWTLQFEGRGLQNRIKGKVKKFEEVAGETGRSRRATARNPSPVRWPHMDDEEDEEESGDYEDSDREYESQSSEEEDEEDSTFVASPER